MRTPGAGFTLVEVVAALVVLGVLLALLVHAGGQSRMQLALADQRLAAARAADRLIATWMQGSSVTALRGGQEGTITGTPGFRWRTVELPAAQARSLGARVVQVRLFGPNDGGTAVGRTGAGDEPLLTVDLLISALPPAHAQSPAGGGPSSAPAAGAGANGGATGNGQGTATAPTTSTSADGLEVREDPRLLQEPIFRGSGQGRPNGLEGR